MNRNERAGAHERATRAAINDQIRRMTEEQQKALADRLNVEEVAERYHLADHKPRPKFLKRHAHPLINTLIAVCSGAVIGIVLALNF